MSTELLSVKDNNDSRPEQELFTSEYDSADRIKSQIVRGVGDGPRAPSTRSDT